jgi:hypothetical protein
VRRDRPEVWEKARYYWPDQPITQQAWVEAIVALEDADRAVARLPRGEDPVDQAHPLDAVASDLASARARLDAWAQHPMAWPGSE